MSPYDKLIAYYYDTLMGDSKHIITPLKWLMRKYKIKPSKVLELGCGTGTVLASFPKTTQLFGLDLSKQMLNKAKKKLPNAHLSLKDMRTFSYNQTFDLIICMYDTINHVLALSDWKRIFDNVSRHIPKGGFFIFDCNSLERLKVLSERPHYAFKLGEDTLIYKIIRKNTTFVTRVESFHKTSKKNYTFNYAEVRETSFPIEKISALLKKHFTIKEIYSIQVENFFPESKRLFFVCQK